MVEISDSVTLISSDGFEFVIDRKCALGSGTIRNMLSSGQFAESLDSIINFRDIKFQYLIRAVILEKVCKYLYYKVRYSTLGDIPEFAIEADIALDLLNASDFLDC